MAGTDPAPVQAEGTPVPMGPRSSFYDQIAGNQWRTAVLMAAFIALLLGAGWAVGYLTRAGWWGLAVASTIALVMTWSSYWYSDSIVLAMSRARPADKGAGDRDAYIINSVEGLAIASGLPVPRSYIIEDPAPNAFATGRDPAHGAIAVTTGLLEKLDRAELEGVLAHEMAHIANRDTLLLTVTAVLVGTIALLGDFMWGWMRFGRRRANDSGGGQLALVLGVVALVLAILSPFAALCIQAAVSRKREFQADAKGAMLTRYPQGLADALKRIAGDPTPLRVANKATASLWIYNPLVDRKNMMDRLFDTHPPADERIRRLEAM